MKPVYYAWCKYICWVKIKQTNELAEYFEPQIFWEANNSQYSSIISFKVALLRCFKHYSSLFLELIVAFRKKKSYKRKNQHNHARQNTLSQFFWYPYELAGYTDDHQRYTNYLTRYDIVTTDSWFLKWIRLYDLLSLVFSSMRSFFLMNKFSFNGVFSGFVAFGNILKRVYSQIFVQFS